MVGYVFVVYWYFLMNFIVYTGTKASLGNLDEFC